MHEPQPLGLLKEMAAKHVLVEICLTSNDVILGVTGARHPLPMYLNYGVPVALATDDEGVSRGNMTQEYQRAAETYHLSYAELKKMARASLTYSFLPGADLQALGNVACRTSGKQTAACSQLLHDSQKAIAEADLEAAFSNFENQFAKAASTGKAKK